MSRRPGAKFIKTGATRQEVPRLREAFDLAWDIIKSRVGDTTVVSERLALLIIKIGKHNPDLDAAEIARRAARAFDAARDQD